MRYAFDKLIESAKNYNDYDAANQELKYSLIMDDVAQINSSKPSAVNGELLNYIADHIADYIYQKVVDRIRSDDVMEILLVDRGVAVALDDQIVNSYNKAIDSLIKVWILAESEKMLRIIKLSPFCITHKDLMDIRKRIWHSYGINSYY